MATYSILIEHLDFSYKKNHPILRDVGLRVPEASIYGFIGPNGAGKSTAMRLIAGIYPDDLQCISVFGKPISSQLPYMFKRVGALVEYPTLYPYLSGEDHLKYIATVQEISFSKIDEALKMVDLLHAKKMKVKQYSLGMKQRLAIAMALLHEPELLLLDEPVNGLDPAGMQEMRALLIRMNREKGVTVFISSHLLGELEKMCSHVGILAKGQIRFEGTIEQLSNQFASLGIEVDTQMSEAHIAWVQSHLPNVHHLTPEKIEVVLSDKEQIPHIAQTLVEQHIPIYGIKNKGSLEEWFMDITKN